MFGSRTTNGSNRLPILVVGSVVPEKDQNLGLPLKRTYVYFIIIHERSSDPCIETDVNHKSGERF